MKKKSLNLNTKFVIVFLSALAALFIVVFAAVQVIAQIYTNNYMKNDVLTTHKTVNGEVTDVLNEINFGYTRMVQSYLLESFVQADSSQKQEIFQNIAQESALSKDYLNVALCVGDRCYCTNASFDLPANSFLQKISSGNVILYMGEINAEQGYVQVGRKFSSALYDVNGYVVFYLDVDVINTLCSITDVAGYTALLTKDYRIVAKSDGKNIGQTVMEQSKIPFENSIFNSKIDGENRLIAVTPMDNQYNLDLYFVSVLSRSVLQRDFVWLSWMLGIIAVACMLVALYFAFKISRFTTAPVKKLSNKISSVDFQTKRGLEIGSEGDELYELERNYEEMLKRLFRLMDENKENMETQRKLEIDALQMQINPHFLYNTLDAIAWMAKIKKQPEIEKLVINLAKFFRISLHKGDKFVTVREETELIEHFVEIEKIRFPDTINYVCEIPQDIADYKTLKLILQPIVENSIKHGFNQKEGVGTVKITAETEGDFLVITVVDDGCGFDVEKDFWTVKTDKPNGYGLYNVHERILLEYGEGCGIDIASQKGVGTTVKVRIKKRL